MGHLSTMFNGFARSLSTSRGNIASGNCGGTDVVNGMSKDVKKKDMILRSSGSVNSTDSKNFAALYTRRGEKGVNQDCFIFWEEFGSEEDVLFCGVFDGHGPWGHFVSKNVRESLPLSLLCNMQEALTEASPNKDPDTDSDISLERFKIWKHSFLKSCATVDQALEHHRKIDAYNSGTTALTIVRQGDTMVIANVGDSRAVLATTSDDGNLVPIQLTTDFKPNLPQETERITQCKGRVFSLNDEPSVHRVWLPYEDAPGLAMSRAFGDYCVKDFGLISVPEVTRRTITSRDRFVILATDGAVVRSLAPRPGLLEKRTDNKAYKSADQEIRKKSELTQPKVVPISEMVEATNEVSRSDSGDSVFYDAYLLHRITDPACTFADWKKMQNENFQEVISKKNRKKKTREKEDSISDSEYYDDENCTLADWKKVISKKNKKRLKAREKENSMLEQRDERQKRTIRKPARLID